MSVDPRPARTRARLATALGELISEGEQRPSVTSIVARAGVHRSSFYLHFLTVEHLAVFALRGQFAEVSRRGQEVFSRNAYPNRVMARASLRIVTLLVQRNARLLVSEPSQGV